MDQYACVYDLRPADGYPLAGLPSLPRAGDAGALRDHGNDWDELADGIAARLASLAPQTGGFSLAPEFLDNLKRTVNRFNGFAAWGRDEDFHRGEFAYDREWTTFPPTIPGAQWPPSGTANYTMYPLSDKGPYTPSSWLLGRWTPTAVPSSTQRRRSWT
jgi:hypothetical protein